MERVVIECNGAGVLESVNFHVCYFGDISEAAMNAIVTDMTDGAATTIAEFNNLSQSEKHIYLGPYFADPAYARPAKIHSKSLKTNGAELGADSDLITEVSGSDGQSMDILFVGTEYGYGYIIKRMISGASGYEPAEFEYQDLHLHNAGFSIASIPGCIYYSTGATSGQANNAGASKSTLYYDDTATNNWINVIDGHPRKRAYGPQGNIYVQGDNNAGGSTYQIPKAIAKRDFICFGASLRNVPNDLSTLAIVGKDSGYGAGITASVVSGKIQFNVDGCVALLCDGNSGRPNVPSANRFWFMFVAHDTQSYLVVNGVTMNVMRTGGVTPLTKSYWTGTILDASSLWRFFRGTDYGVSGGQQWEFAHRFLINNTPSDDTITKITALMNRINLI
ncbi:MAG: hypothetical protein HUU10_04500 [Bacteroidetes bacterium]|nr:hypothetical protein [Bacteroidota bacterium]